jgi:hypothetical protein
VVRPDGSEVEVNLTSDLKQVGTAAEDDGGRNESDDEGQADED